jgi:hypothetical protein
MAAAKPVGVANTTQDYNLNEMYGSHSIVLTKLRNGMGVMHSDIVYQTELLSVARSKLSQPPLQEWSSQLDKIERSFAVLNQKTTEFREEVGQQSQWMNAEESATQKDRASELETMLTAVKKCHTIAKNAFKELGARASTALALTLAQTVKAQGNVVAALPSPTASASAAVVEGSGPGGPVLISTAVEGVEGQPSSSLVPATKPAPGQEKLAGSAGGAAVAGNGNSALNEFRAVAKQLHGDLDSLTRKVTELDRATEEDTISSDQYDPLNRAWADLNKQYKQKIQPKLIGHSEASELGKAMKAIEQELFLKVNRINNKLTALAQRVSYDPVVFAQPSPSATAAAVSAPSTATAVVPKSGPKQSTFTLVANAKITAGNMSILMPTNTNIHVRLNDEANIGNLNVVKADPNSRAYSDALKAIAAQPVPQMGTSSQQSKPQGNAKNAATVEELDTSDKKEADKKDQA